MMFAPMAQAPPKAGAKELLYGLNLIHEFRSLFRRKVIFAGLLRKAYPQKHAFVDMSVFLVAQATAKICPKPAQGLFSNKRT